MSRGSSSGPSSHGLLERLFAEIPGDSLAFFRIAFGGILLWEMLRFFAAGWIEKFYLEPTFHFTYWGFSWLSPWPGALLHFHFVALALAAACIALGLYHRLASAVFFLGFSYVFLLEKARYLNHFYLVILLCFLLIIVPAHHAFSLDARRQRHRPGVPAWSLWVLRAQIGLVYFYAALAKLNPDWLHARPLDEWLRERASHPLLGPLLSHPFAPWLFSYGGLLLDLLATPLLLWRRTRLACFLVTLAFHLTNAALFGIGIFPWMMIAANTLFFEPDWPRRLLRLLPADVHTQERASEIRRRTRTPTVAFLAVYLSVQVLVPLRHFLYPGDVSWTEEGHAFSWHMKLRDKENRLSFVVIDKDSGQRFLVDPRVDLKEWQVEKGGGRPDMILEYAHHLAGRYRAKGHQDVEVRAAAAVSLNGHPYRWLVDPKADLTQERRGLHPYRWVVRDPQLLAVEADGITLPATAPARSREREW